MEKFIISEKRKDCADNQIKFQRHNGWDKAYIGVEGETAFTEGLYLGAANAYSEAAIDIKKFIKKLLKINPDLKASELIELIKN